MIEFACIGLGSNLGDREQTLYHALQALDAHADIRVAAVAPLYGSTPVGPQDQPDFLNSAACLTTRLDPHALLDALQHVEQQLGRVRQRHWGERTLDLDLLLYGEQRIDTLRLTVPHAQMLKRRFVLQPLADIAAQRIIPGTALSVADALAACNEQGLWYHGPCDWNNTGGHESV